MTRQLGLFTTTLFVSATLLFLVQPMFGRMILPLFGGSPGVWNVSVVFFQLLLLAGYAYAHLSVRWLGVRRQSLLHLVMLAVPLAVLPIHVRTGGWTPSSGQPLLSVFLVLLLSVGLPFFMVATSAPLLQRWYGSTRDAAAHDPFFLYASSNAGSMGALLAYPVLVEPSLRLGMQSLAWAWGYGVLTLLTGVCAFVVWRSGQDIPEAVVADRAEPDPGWSTRLHWLALSAVPSSLMLSVTTYLSTDIASVPLLWILPLAIYLLTFVLAFAKRPLIASSTLSALLPIAVLPPLLAIASDWPGRLGSIPVHIVTLFVAALFCHSELARRRPGVTHLTEFYLWMSIGGAIGGLFNTLVAPVLFRTTAEYPLALILAVLLRPTPTDADRRAWSSWTRRRTADHAISEDPGEAAGGAMRARGERWMDVGLPVLLGLLVLLLLASARAVRLIPQTYGYLAHVFALPCAVALAFWRRPVRLGLGLGAIILFAGLYPETNERLLYTERSFYGVHRVIDRPTTRVLMHGTTNHGAQSLDPSNRCLPSTYYYPTGPLGALFDSFEGAFAKSSVGVVGLGTGSVAGYSRSGQRWTFYELSPTVVRIARDPRYFTFLRDCSEDARVVIGDARLSLAAQPNAVHDVLIVDAFSSDAIPVHLLTREAIELYLQKLSPHGVMAFNISNRYLDLSRVVGRLASDTGIVAYLASDDRVTLTESTFGKAESVWVVLARTKADLGGLVDQKGWNALTPDPSLRPWTDDYSNILQVLDW